MERRSSLKRSAVGSKVVDSKLNKKQSWPVHGMILRSEGKRLQEAAATLGILKPKLNHKNFTVKAVKTNNNKNVNMNDKTILNTVVTKVDIEVVSTVDTNVVLIDPKKVDIEVDSNVDDNIDKKDNKDVNKKFEKTVDTNVDSKVDTSAGTNVDMTVKTKIKPKTGVKIPRIEHPMRRRSASKLITVPASPVTPKTNSVVDLQPGEANELEIAQVPSTSKVALPQIILSRLPNKEHHNIRNPLKKLEANNDELEIAQVPSTSKVALPQIILSRLPNKEHHNIRNPLKKLEANNDETKQADGNQPDDGKKTKPAEKPKKKC